ncbi:hypothetical protein [Schleiferilactobacillus shenzhenensis]|nr:hypothetical protein [Schleiferilactobacillus shenzhenensis]
MRIHNAKWLLLIVVSGLVLGLAGCRAISQRLAGYEPVQVAFSYGQQSFTGMTAQGTKPKMVFPLTDKTVTISVSHLSAGYKYEVAMDTEAKELFRAYGDSPPAGVQSMGTTAEVSQSDPKSNQFLKPGKFTLTVRVINRKTNKTIETVTIPYTIR